MGNLGAYQWVTTISKKVGGPFQLLGITALGGYVVFRGLEAGGKYVLASSNISEADKASADMAFLRVGKRQSRARV